MINSLDEFETFLKKCRKHGVTEIQYQGVSVTFGEIKEKPRRGEDTEQEIQTDGLTPEQLAFYSVGTPE